MPPISEAEQYGYSDSSWAKVPEHDRALLRIIRPLPRAHSTGNHMFKFLEAALQDYADSARTMGGTYDLNPDFQRGHVWTQAQQIAFMESALRGAAPLNLKFNAPWEGGRQVTDPTMHKYDFVCIDGLQRLTAIRQFMAGAFPVFDRFYVADLAGTTFDPNRMSMSCTFEIYTFTTRQELLRFYLALNSGGTVHTSEELDRVRGLLAQAPDVALPPAEAPQKATPTRRRPR